MRLSSHHLWYESRPWKRKDKGKTLSVTRNHWPQYFTLLQWTLICVQRKSHICPLVCEFDDDMWRSTEVWCTKVRTRDSFWTFRFAGGAGTSHQTFIASNKWRQRLGRGSTSHASEFSLHVQFYNTPSLLIFTHKILHLLLRYLGIVTLMDVVTLVRRHQVPQETTISCLHFAGHSSLSAMCRFGQLSSKLANNERRISWMTTCLLVTLELYLYTLHSSRLTPEYWNRIENQWQVIRVLVS